MPIAGLSKSKILSYRQCPKRLWLERHKPDEKVVSTASERAFATGHEVGAVARSLLPDGILIGHENDLARALVETQEALAQRPVRPLFEAAFAHQDVLARVDVLIPQGRAHRLCEVKSSAKVADYYLDDCAVQAWVAKGAGLKVASVELVHLNSAFVYPGNNRFENLFQQTQVDAALQEDQVPGWVAGARKTLAEKEPSIAMGKQCDKPYECPFKTYCARDLPKSPKYPVTLLPYSGKLAVQLTADGYTDLRKVPAARLTNDLHKRIHIATKSGKPYIGPQAGKILRALPYPRYHLDFESMNFAVPRWPGIKPYQQVAFQWSCHIEKAPGSIEHHAFLSLDTDDPSKELAQSLIEILGDKGPVFAYNAIFEDRILKDLAARLPKHRKSIEAIRGRLYDLLPFMREHYYHPAMKGSWKLKGVLPTITPELDYATLDGVQHGGDAQGAYLEAIKQETSTERRQHLRRGLLAYCERDTLAMVHLARYFS